MNVVWKLTLERECEFDLYVPRGAKVLYIDSQNNVGCMWILVSQNMKYENIRCISVGTGQSIPVQFTKYLGTWQDKQYIWHLFCEETDVLYT